MKIGALLALIVGLALAIFLVMHIGIAQVFEAAAHVGWGGFALILLSALPVVVFLGLAWRTLVGPLAPLWVFFASRQLRDCATDLLPFTQIGGVVIGARAGILGGIPPVTANASAMVDITCEIMAQVAFTVLGMLIGLTTLRASPELAPYANGLILGTALLVPALAAFVVLQRKGSRLATKMAAQFLPNAVAQTNQFTAHLEALYRQPAKLALCSTYHLMAWLASAAWLWVIFQLCGATISLMDCIAIESLLAALRAVTVFIPASVGVQEAGYAALAPLFGVGPEIGLAVSLLKRARDVVLGVPVLLIWQLIEGRRAFARDNGSMTP
ncbi:MAG: lysylphosphatidylglycerol synthase domain-containing protein [Rhizomicrobium sp.]|nr:lysylphosphatidylglycerol synthase domain-containing protein [Rhizomicrobium sp.]